MDDFILKNSCLSADTCQRYIDIMDTNAHRAIRGTLGTDQMDDLEVPINVYQEPEKIY